MQAPSAKQKKHQLTIHHHQREDLFYWLNQRESPEVLAYIEAENAYTQSIMKPTEDLQSQLFDEMKARMKEDEDSVPYLLDDFYYYSKFVKGGEYPVYCRKYKSMEAEEEVLLDGNKMAMEHAFFQIASTSISPNHRYIAYALDTVGRRIYTIHIKDLQTGEILEDEMPWAAGDIVWGNDNAHIFYDKQDQDTLRSFQVYRHRLYDNSENDVLVFEEKDETFEISVGKSKSKQYIFIQSGATLSDEWHYLDANQPLAQFNMFHPRERELEYGLEHFGDHFYILTNYQAKNFRLMRQSISASTKTSWEEVIPHDKQVFIEDVELFQDYLVVERRKAGILGIDIYPWNNFDGMYALPTAEATGNCSLAFNPTFDTHTLRYSYNSLLSPRSVFDFNMKSKEQTLVKQKEILGGYLPENFRSEFIYAEARDGTAVPISIVYHKDTPINGTAPLLLYAYGSYGISNDSYVSIIRLSLLERGYVFAIAHIRGGSELGRIWYEDGKMMKKKNTFTDFIDCTEHLIKHQYCDPKKVNAMGGSAGGLLMGAIANMRPELFRSIIAAVPFVDVVTTMLDDSIPLTTGEYDEWGNPNEAEAYHYMLSYSPYDNVSQQAYPHMLITSGFHDSQVQYWEPAKWIAKLRINNTSDKLLLLNMEMEAGHGGASGRYNSLKEFALMYAFLLKTNKENDEL